MPELHCNDNNNQGLRANRDRLAHGTCAAFQVLESFRSPAAAIDEPVRFSGCVVALETADSKIELDGTKQAVVVVWLAL